MRSNYTHPRAARPWMDNLTPPSRCRSAPFRPFRAASPVASVPAGRTRVCIARNTGRLYEKHHQYDLALRAYSIVEDRSPESFENHARVVNTLVLAGKKDEAVNKAISLVDRYRASSESLTLLKSIYKQIGREKDII